MFDPLSIFLLFVFSVHLVVFAGLYLRHKKKHHLLFALVFFLLILSQTIRLWDPQWSMYGHTVHQYVRLAAWVTTAVAAIFWMRQRQKL